MIKSCALNYVHPSADSANSFTPDRRFVDVVVGIISKLLRRHHEVVIECDHGESPEESLAPSTLSSAVRQSREAASRAWLKLRLGNELASHVQDSINSAAFITKRSIVIFDDDTGNC